MPELRDPQLWVADEQLEDLRRAGGARLAHLLPLHAQLAVPELYLNLAETCC